MSRIAGAVSQGFAAPLDGMLASLARPGWTPVTASAGAAALGWSGLAGGGVAEVKGVLVALDGRIYNRAELGAGGSDTEAVASLYRRHGLDGALRRLNGDFALAVYDPALDALFLARDRFGIKPLYYAAAAELFAFASQPRALLGLPGVSHELDRRYLAVVAASHYRYFDNEPERSPYADVAQLPAAHLLELRGGAVRTRPWWELAGEPDLDGTEEELAQRLRDLLLDAVSLRLGAAQRPAFTLSGGMDSSSVLGCAVAAAGARQHAFSAVYADATYDEAAEIASMLDAAVERWHPVPIGTPDVFGIVDRLVALHDEPVATATWLSHFLLAEEAAREGFSFLFGGLGGDELNAGEYEYFLCHFADLRAAGLEEELEREVERWAAFHDHPVYRKSREAADAGLARLVDPSRPGRCLPDRERLERYARALDPDFFDLAGYEPELEHPFGSYLKNRAWQDLTRETLPCCLRAQDRQGTALGLEHALPFLDHRLVELMFRVPGRLKIRDGVTKRLLREAMRGILPEETRTRVKKTGWNAPAHVWFSEGRERLLDLVHSQRFRERGIYDAAEVERLVLEHDEIVRSGKPRENHMMFLWQLVNLEAWLTQVDARRLAATPQPA